MLRRAASVLQVSNREKHFSAVTRVLMECMPMEENFGAGNLVLVGRIEPALVSFHRSMKRDVGYAGVMLIAAALTLCH